MAAAGAQDAEVTERLDQLGSVADVCREIGLAAWLDARKVGYTHATPKPTAAGEKQTPYDQSEVTDASWVQGV
jgi:hypothetical protein